jgi:hypothetical protein
MTEAFDRMGFEESVLYSDDDYEPYGYVTVQPAAEAATQPCLGPFEREVEAAVLRQLDAYPGC